MRRYGIAAGGTAALVTLVVGAMTAFACIPIAMLSLSQTQAAPGSQVTAFIHQINDSSYPAITFHWQTIDGPVLATASPTGAGVTATFTVPASAQPGDYVVIATTTAKDATFKSADNATWGMPARAVLHVTSPGGQVVSSAPGAATPTTASAVTLETGPAVGLLVLLGAGVAAVALSLAGIAFWAVDRRRAQTASA